MDSSIVNSLAEKSYAVWDDACPRSLWQNFLTSLQQKQLRKATINQSLQTMESKIETSSIRGDSIEWLEPHSSPEAYDFIEGLKKNLNETLYLGIENFEAHWAVYPVGSRYQKHIDQKSHSFNPIDGYRVMSFILYLNPDWKTDHGGELLIHSKTPLKITPVGGRLVLFFSDIVEHEVLETFAPRYSLTGWFRKRTL